jgi:hypothetical protein
MERCNKCGSQKTLKDKDLVCIFCVGKKQGMAKPGYVPPIDPGEAGIQKVLKTAKVGVDTLETKGSKLGSIGIVGGSLPPSTQSALKIMQSLSMPDDIKQFKQIKKIIQQMEKLIEVQNNGVRSVSSK